MILALIFTFLKNVIYGASVFFTGALSVSVDVLDILALRFLLTFIVLYILKITKILKIRVGIRDVFQKTERHRYIKYLLLAALFEPVLYMLFETLGISMTTGITAGVILSLGPVTSCLCEEVILKEKAPCFRNFSWRWALWAWSTSPQTPPLPTEKTRRWAFCSSFSPWSAVPCF